LKRISINKILLITIIFGIPNFFIVYDQTGLYNYIDGLDFNIVSRLFLFFSAFFYVLIKLIFNPSIDLKIIKSLKIPIIFYLSFLALIPFGNKLSIQESLYRIFEWIIFFMILYYYMYNRNKKFLIENYLSILTLLSYLLIIVIFFGLIFFPDLIYPERLGGSVIGPNTLGVISSILFFHNFIKKRYILSFLFVVFIFLSQSRGALICFLISGFYYILSRPGKAKYFTSIIFIIVTFILSSSISVLLLRNQNIENIFTFSERYYVFLSSIEMIKSNYIFGTGFVTGTTQIADYMSSLGIEHWQNYHSHNEFLQAFSTGGFVQFILCIYIFKVIFQNSKKIFKNIDNSFLIINFFHLIYFSISMTTISYVLSPIACLTWLTFIMFQSNDN
tara:strand:- start:510 stop:1676 length:1167 start_codon:yes stop_codon:yes gene_type:complete